MIPKNLKINTRIVLNSILAIIIPVILIALFTVVFFASVSSQMNSAPSVSYNILTQIQWNQISADIANVLEMDIDTDEKLNRIKDISSYMEKDGTLLYIRRNGSEFYSSASDENIYQKAFLISPNHNKEDSYCLSENGLLISLTVFDKEAEYHFIILNENIAMPDFSDNEVKNVMGTFINRASIIIIVVVLIFITAIVIVSLITSKTIVTPIRQISEGVNEIANGNFEYEIQYKSTNELGRLAESFNDMRLRIKDSIEEQSRADQKQKEMIAGIAHDLRTPLTSVKGYLEGLRDGIADTPEKKNRYMDIIYSSTNDIEKMLDDLLTISKLELGSVTLNCERVKITDFLPFAEEVRAELEKNDFDLEIIDKTKNPVALNLDTDSFSRVINNIVSNSIKYRNKDVRGKIEMTILEYKNTILFEIKDNGMGVARQNLPRIFDTLYRTDRARSNSRNGSGLGLSICKQIVEMHGGLIWAQSDIGKGLSIFISLPIYKEEE